MEQKSIEVFLFFKPKGLFGGYTVLHTGAMTLFHTFINVPANSTLACTQHTQRGLKSLDYYNFLGGWCKLLGG